MSKGFLFVFDGPDGSGKTTAVDAIETPLYLHFKGQRDVLHIRMPGGSGIDLLTTVKARHPGLPVIIMTANSDLDSAVSAFQGGAFEYLTKPFDLEKAIELIREAFLLCQVRSTNVHSGYG